MRELALEHPRRGRRQIMELLHKERWPVGVRLIKRRWRREALLVPQERVKRGRIGTGEDGIKRRQASLKNEVWGIDFMQYRTADSRPFRMLVVLDVTGSLSWIQTWSGRVATSTGFSWRGCEAILRRSRIAPL